MFQETFLNKKGNFQVSSLGDYEKGKMVNCDDDTVVWQSGLCDSKSV